MTSLNIEVFVELEDTYKPQLAELLRLRHLEFSDMPPHDLSYYLDPLSQPPDEDIGLVYLLATEEQNLLGYAILEYRNPQYNEKTASLNLFVLKAQRGKGIGGKLFKATRDHIPSHVNIIRMHAEKGSHSSSIIQSKLQVQPTYSSQHSFLEIRSVDREWLDRELESRINQIDYSLEIIYRSSDTYHDLAREYAALMEQVWNMGADEFELFPVERLHGRMEYFQSHSVFVHIFFLRDTESKGLVGLSEIVCYGTNKLVADEGIIGILPGYENRGLEYLLKLKSLEFLLESTEVTHWESAIGQDNTLEEVNRQLGFLPGKTFDRYELPVGKIIDF